MKRLYLITHPAVNIDPNTPVNQWSISKDGWKSVIGFMDHELWSEVEEVYASSEPKAYNAAGYWAGNIGLAVKIVEGIQEIDRTSTGFIPEPEFGRQDEAFWVNPSERVRGWESVEECYKRMKLALDKIINESEKDVVAVVSHGAVTNMYVAKMRGMVPGIATGQKELGSWITIDVKNNKVSGRWKIY